MLFYCTNVKLTGFRNYSLRLLEWSLKIGGEGGNVQDRIWESMWQQWNIWGQGNSNLKKYPFGLHVHCCNIAIKQLLVLNIGAFSICSIIFDGGNN